MFGLNFVVLVRGKYMHFLVNYFYLSRQEFHTSSGKKEQKFLLVLTQPHLMRSRVYNFENTKARSFQQVE